jgi:predicted DNA-binding ribbon-helix-helix protein
MPVIPFRHERAIKNKLREIASARGMKLNRLMQVIVDEFLQREGILRVERKLN